MADRTDTANEMLFDRRLARRNIEKGLLSQADYDKSIADLADMEANAEVVNIDEEEKAAEEAKAQAAAEAAAGGQAEPEAAAAPVEAAPAPVEAAPAPVEAAPAPAEHTPSATNGLGDAG